MSETQTFKDYLQSIKTLEPTEDSCLPQEEFERRKTLLIELLRNRLVELRFHEADFIEPEVLAKKDREEVRALLCQLTITDGDLRAAARAHFQPNKGAYSDGRS